MPPVTFQQIVTMFREIDILHMKGLGVLLDDYAYMSDSAGDHKNAQAVYDSLTGAAQPQMPPGGPYWTRDQLDLFAKWMSDGYVA